MKRSRISGRNFGFIRYEFEEEAKRAIVKANGLWIDNRRLVVKIANYDKKQEPRKDCSVNNMTRSQNCFLQSAPQLRGYNEERPTYAQVTREVECVGKIVATRSIQCHAIGNGWLFRSVIAKSSRLLSAKDLERIFELEKVHDVQIKAIGGRYVVITFANEKTRDKMLEERWVKNWFNEFQPWNGEQAKEERFVWISCFGMPLSAWSSLTFKDIGSIWGEFLEVDENTLKGGSYDKGRILIATDQSQRIEGYVELVVDGMRYIVRVEEEEGSYRKVESSNFHAVDESISVHKDQLSEVPKEAQSFENNTEDDPKFTEDLESFVEDSMGLQSLFLESHVVESIVKRKHDKVLDVNSVDSSSIDKADSGGSDYEDEVLVSNEPLIKYVECMRHKKTHKTKKIKWRRSLWSKNSLKTAKLSRSVRRDCNMNVSRTGSMNGSFDEPTHLIQEEVSSVIHKNNSFLIKEARENMKLGARFGVKFHGRESYNIKKFLESKGVEISEEDIKAEITTLDILEGEASISVDF